MNAQHPGINISSPISLQRTLTRPVSFNRSCIFLLNRLSGRILEELVAFRINGDLFELVYYMAVPCPIQLDIL